MIIALSMWIIFIVLWIAAHKTDSTRWAMALVFFAGLAGFGVFWGDHKYQIVEHMSYLGYTIKIHSIIGSVFSWSSHYFIPYCALMFGLSYAEVLNPKTKKIVPVLLLIPMIILLYFYPTHDYYFDDTSMESVVYYWFFSIWAVPYLLISCILLISSYVKEQIPSKKKQRLNCCLVAVPGMVFSAITTYILGGLPADGTWKYWRFNIFMTPYMCCIFLYNLFTYGVLGIKLQIRKQNLDNMMDVLNTGMQILSHSLKNEITKISLCMTNIRLSLDHPDRVENDIQEDIQMVSTSLEYLSNMMTKLQRNVVNPGKFEPGYHNLAEIMEMALQCVAVFLKSKEIHVNQNVGDDLMIFCDKVYLQEVFVSLFQNAIEAMDVYGELSLEASLTSKGLTISVKDNGAGICEKDLPHVIEPFFTTKDKKDNFGLGLSYCYNILKQHGASLDVQSKQNIGTTVSLFFPKNKVMVNRTTDRGLRVNL